jgi:hypothetical protein
MRRVTKVKTRANLARRRARLGRAARRDRMESERVKKASVAMPSVKIEGGGNRHAIDRAVVRTVSIAVAEDDPPMLMLVGLAEHVDFAGAPLQVRLRFPLKPFGASTVSAKDCVCPAVIVASEIDDDSVKSCPTP